jgi:hypothetical protein
MGRSSGVQQEKMEMPQLKQGDLRFPLNGSSAARLRARIDRISSNQATAATLTEQYISETAGKIQALSVVIAATPGVGESLVVDVQNNGVSLLTAPATLDSATSGKGVKSLPVIANSFIAAGDVITFIRTYTAGGAPALATPNRIVLEVA